MSDKRYLGNIITPTPTAPAGPYESDAAPGVWSLQEAYTYIKAGTWPTAGNVLPRLLFAGGVGRTTTIDYVDPTTTGNAVDYADLSTAVSGSAGAGNSTRALFGGGSSVATIQFISYAGGGVTSTFGDMVAPAGSPGVGVSSAAGVANATRALFAGGNENANTTQQNKIDFVTIATTGNASDFGDLTEARTTLAGFASSTRAVFGGGRISTSNTFYNYIDYVTIASAGNATDFGDLLNGTRGIGATSSATRGLFAGGETSGGVINVIQYVTIASAGDTSDFGDLTVVGNFFNNSCGNTATRSVFGGANDRSNVIDFVTTASLGNATDFGDLTVGGYTIAAACSVNPAAA
jgi:hypothetical protein